MQNRGTAVLETDRLILRRFQSGDEEKMYQNWAKDPEVTEFLTWPAHGNVEVTRRVMEDWIARYTEPSYYNWAIVLKDGEEIVGNISVIKLNERTEAAEIGYCMGKAWWGQGIMPEALKAVITYLLDEVGLYRIAASHDVNNPKSGRVMEKAGMKREGIWRAAAVNRHGRDDLVWYSILKSDR